MESTSFEVDQAISSVVKQYFVNSDLLKDCVEYATIGGKRIRGRIYLDSLDRICKWYHLVGDDEEEVFEKLKVGAAGVELVHEASLILDDGPKMDHSSERRGRPAVYVKYGEASAQLAALSMVSVSGKLYTDIITKELNNGSCSGIFDEKSPFEFIVFAKRSQISLNDVTGENGLCLGQLIDLTMSKSIDNGGEKWTLSDYLRMARLKTGKLFAAAVGIPLIMVTCASLAINRRRLANPTTNDDFDEVLHQNIEAAESLGIAFQIIDDLEDPIENQSLPNNILSYISKEEAIGHVHKYLKIAFGDEPASASIKPLPSFLNKSHYRAMLHKLERVYI